MKKKLLSLILTVCMLVTAIPAFTLPVAAAAAGDTVEKDGFIYRIITPAVTGVGGSHGILAVAGVTDKAKGDYVIPSGKLMLNSGSNPGTYDICSIDTNAFDFDLNSLVIPPSVVEISANAIATRTVEDEIYPKVTVLIENDLPHEDPLAFGKAYSTSQLLKFVTYKMAAPAVNGTANWGWNKQPAAAYYIVSLYPADSTTAVKTYLINDITHTNSGIQSISMSFSDREEGSYRTGITAVNKVDSTIKNSDEKLVGPNTLEAVDAPVTVTEVTRTSADTVSFTLTTTETINYKTSITEERGAVDARALTKTLAAGTHSLTVDIPTSTNLSTLRIPYRYDSAASLFGTFHFYGHIDVAIPAFDGKEQVSTPVISPSGGAFYGDSQEVTISCTTDGATIYYQLDDSVFLQYNGPLSINTDTTVRAYAKKDGMEQSETAVATFTKEVQPVITEAVVIRTGETTGRAMIRVNADVQAAWVIGDNHPHPHDLHATKTLTAGANYIDLFDLDAGEQALDIHLYGNTEPVGEGRHHRYTIPAEIYPAAAPAISNLTAERTGLKTATVTFTANKAGVYRFDAVGEREVSPSFGRWFDCVAGENTFNISDISDTATKRIYVQMADLLEENAESSPGFAALEAWTGEIPYFVTYDLNGGSGTVPVDETEYTKGATVTVLSSEGITPPSPTFRFDSWNTQADGLGTDYQPGETFQINENVTLYARWAVASTPMQHFRVTYDLNGGEGTTPVDERTYEYGENATILGIGDARHPLGHPFSHWNTQPDGSGDRYLPIPELANSTIEVKGNVTLYARWMTDAVPVTKVTVTYDANLPVGTSLTSGQVPVDSTEYSLGAAVTVADGSDMKLDGYSFNGWNTKADGSGDSFSAGAAFEIFTDTVLYAKWAPKIASGHTHAPCGNVCSHDGSHSALTYTAWDKTDSLPTASGTYYLTGDVVLPAPEAGATTYWTVAAGADITICLAGHQVTVAEPGRISGGHVEEGASLTLADCSLNVGSFEERLTNYGTLNIFGGSYIADHVDTIDNYATFNLYGGIISTTATYGTAVGNHNDGITYMYGGTLTGCTNNGISNYNQVYLYGGTISDNEVGIANYGDLIVTGGTVIGNGVGFEMKRGSALFSGASITANATGVLFAEPEYDFDEDAVLTLGGSLTVENNTDHNVYLPKDRFITVASDIQNSRIGISMHFAGIFTSGNGGIDTADNFFSDNSDYNIVIDETSGELTLNQLTDTTPPILTAGKAARTGADSFTVKFSSNEAGQYYYQVTEKGAEAPTFDTTSSGTLCDLSTQTITFSGLPTRGEYTCYVVVKDEVGQVSAPISFDIVAWRLLSYDANSGEGTLPATVGVANGASAYVKDGILTHPEGKLFLGWNTASDGSGTGYLPENIITLWSDVILYAVWGTPAAHIHTVDRNGTGEAITFTPWSSRDSLPTEPGNYFLMGDVTISSSWIVPDGVTLCLNGRYINLVDEELDGEHLYNTVLLVDDNITATICDCNVNQVRHLFTRDEQGLYHLFTGTSKPTGVLTSSLGYGVITGGSYSGINNYGTLYLYDLAVVGNSENYSGVGGGIYNSGTLYIGGSTAILGNIALDGRSGGVGGGIYNSGDLFLDGGMIYHNVSDSCAGICSCYGNLTMTDGGVADNVALVDHAGGIGLYRGEYAFSSNAYVKNNKVGEGESAIDSDLYLFSGAEIEVGDFIDSASLGITMKLPGIFTSGNASAATGGVFFSNDPDYEVLTDAISGELMLRSTSGELTITYQTDRSDITYGEKYVLFVTAQPADINDAVTYQWYRDGILQEGETDYSIRLNTLPASDTPYIFTCVVTDDSGSLTSAPIPVTIAKREITPVITATKEYDASADIVISSDMVTFREDDLVNGDTLQITGLTGSFADAEVGEDKPLTLDDSAMTVIGDAAASYAIVLPFEPTGSITPAKAYSLAITYPATLPYTGQPVPMPTEEQITLTTYTDLTLDDIAITWYWDGEASAAPYKPGTHTLQGGYLDADGVSVLTNLVSFEIVAPLHEHPLCGKLCSHDPADPAVSYTAWAEKDTLPTDSGKYFLLSDVALPIPADENDNGHWNIGDGVEITLCLNGCDISFAMLDDFYGIYIGEGGSLTLCDCMAEPGVIAGDIRIENGSFTMYGGTLTSPHAEYGGIDNEGGTVMVNGGLIADNPADGILTKGGTVTVNGGTISGSYYNGIYGYEGCTIIVNGGLITENGRQGLGDGIYTNGTATVTVNGGTVSKNAGDAIDIDINDDGNDPGVGTLAINGGLFTENGGHGVELNCGSLLLSAGSLKNNDECGVYMSAGSFIMTDGLISGNNGNGIHMLTGTADICGGTVENNIYDGIHILDGELLFSGGTVSGNVDGLEVRGGTATVTGGLLKDNSDEGLEIRVSSVTMTGGTISGNGGAGVKLLDPTSFFEITGGTVTGNGEGGILVLEGKLSISGSPDVSGNVCAHTSEDDTAVPEDIWLERTALPIRVGALGDIQLMIGMSEPGIFTEEGAEEQQSKFVSQHEDYFVGTEDGKLKLSKYLWITFDANGGDDPIVIRRAGTDGRVVPIPRPSDRGFWRFDGWFTAKVGGTKVTTATVFTKDATVYGQWTYGGPDLTVWRTLSFSVGEGTPVADCTVEQGSILYLSSFVTAREGYRFTGWYTSPSLTVPVNVIKLDHNTTVYAGWEKIEEPQQPPVTETFDDVTELDWFYEDVLFVLGRGLMLGTEPDRFSPALTTTRGMIVTVLYRLEGEPGVSGARPFPDVQAGSYYEDAVIWAAANSIIGGYPDGTFGANDNITREQLATILYRYAQYKGYDVSISEETNILSFDDATEINGYAIPAMQWACGAGIMGGKGNGKLDPLGPAQRCEVAAILHRFCKLYEA